MVRGPSRGPVVRSDMGKLPGARAGWGLCAVTGRGPAKGVAGHGHGGGLAVGCVTRRLATALRARVRSLGLCAPAAVGGDAALRDAGQDAAVDVQAKPLELGLHKLGRDLDPPRTVDSVSRLGHPAIAARLERVLRRDGREHRPQAHGVPKRVLAQRGQHPLVRVREALREQPHPELAVGERAVAVSGEGVVVTAETVQGGARAVVGGPGHLAHRAGPGHLARCGQDPFEEGAVRSARCARR